MSHGCYTPTPAVRRLKSDFVYVLAFITSKELLRYYVRYSVLFYSQVKENILIVI